MENFKLCDNCKEYHWTNEDCEPEYFVYYEDYLGDDPKSVRGNSHDNAAINFAKYYNTQTDYALMNETIEIKVEKDGIVKSFRVGAEPDIHYSSKEL